MTKLKQLHIRLYEKDMNYLNDICEKLQCTKTQYITELLRKGEYTQITYDGFNDFQKQFGAIGNNINQIARALNIIKNSDQMTDDQYEEILKSFEAVRNEYLKYQDENIRMLKMMYRNKREKVRYEDLSDDE